MEEEDDDDDDEKIWNFYYSKNIHLSKKIINKCKIYELSKFEY